MKLESLESGGFGGTDRDFARFLTIVNAPCGEVRSQLYAALDVALLPGNN